MGTSENGDAASHYAARTAQFPDSASGPWRALAGAARLLRFSTAILVDPAKQWRGKGGGCGGYSPPHIASPPWWGGCGGCSPPHIVIIIIIIIDRFYIALFWRSLKDALHSVCVWGGGGYDTSYPQCWSSYFKKVISNSYKLLLPKCN